MATQVEQYFILQLSDGKEIFPPLTEPDSYCHWVNPENDSFPAFQDMVRIDKLNSGAYFVGSIQKTLSGLLLPVGRVWTLKQDKAVHPGWPQSPVADRPTNISTWPPRNK